MALAVGRASGAGGTGPWLRGLVACAWLGLARCYDMYPCKDKSTYTNMSCPVGAAVACWSLEPAVPWLCWSPALVPQWLFGPLPGTPGDVNCKSYPAPPGSKRPFYDGVCTFQAPSKVAVPALQPPPLNWDEAYEKANKVLAQMTDPEKYGLMNGLGWYWPPWGGWWDLRKYYYVGNTAPVKRLGIPSLNMQDSAGGFRPYWSDIVGTVTCWPSQLSLSATWDAEIVKMFAMALGAEFAGKGANVILGPSVEVHRVARGGRNFEYISGEDPYLGSRLVPAWVEGMQSQGILAVAKHYVFNQQETNRETEDSLVDKKTTWELYLPPFQAAVKAGVSAAMCSYNKENGWHSCSNAEMLGVLKNDIGFRGFVQSDWWALHRMGLPEGTDQDMPGISDPGIANHTSKCIPGKGCLNESSWFMPSQLKKQPKKLVDDAARRILAAIFRMDLKAACAPPGCKEWFLQNVTSESHVALARYICAESIVLLKNVGVLPLIANGQTKVKSIAIIGEAAVAKAYNPAGLGQGHGIWNQGDYYSGGGSGHVAAAPHQLVNPLVGLSNRAKIAGIEVIVSASNSTSEAVAAAQKADVSLVVGATTGQEAIDRPNLNLDGHVDALISEVAKVAKRTVVLMQVPGEVLTPWRDDVQAILAMFLGGQVTGDCWADVVFGDHVPSGRLPVMMPAAEADTIPPGFKEKVPYTEGLKTSYRNKAFKAAFPFGHGLTYTNFGYDRAAKVECRDGAHGDLCLTVTLRNIGTVAAKAVPQLYLEMPPEAGHPVPLLKGFSKTAVILPGVAQDVLFRLTDEDLRYYDAHLDKWARPGWVTAHVGESSADIRLTVPLVVGKNPTGRTLWIVLGIIIFLGLILVVILLVRNSGRRKGEGSEELCGGEDSDETNDSSSLEDSEA